MGVLEAASAPVSISVSGRRYLCRSCGCVMLVVPTDVSARRRYTLATIALALARFSVGQSATSIRARLSPNATFDEGWPSLRRWLRAVATGKLFRWIRGVSELSGRALAERVSAVIAEASGADARSGGFEDRVWKGVMSNLEM